MTVAMLLFDDFETLDVFGPVEIFGRLKEHYQIFFYAVSGGLIKNNHGVSTQTEDIENLKDGADIFIIPGGYGTRKLIENAPVINKVKEIAQLSKFVLTVCTGSAILGKTGLLDGKKATSNKRAFDLVTTHGEKVNWIKKARWVKDGKFYTSAGVSAGMDMALGFIADMHGIELAQKVAFEIEYNWIDDMEEDGFYEQ